MNNKTNETKKPTEFEVGVNYHMTFVGDSSLKPLFTCIKRTESMAVLQSVENDTEKLSRKINVDDDGEYIVAGVYSMAPRIHSKRIAK